MESTSGCQKPKTFLKKLGSKSVTKGAIKDGVEPLHMILTRLGNGSNQEALRAAVKAQLLSRLEKPYDHAEELKADLESVQHMDKTLRYMLHMYLSGLGFVRNTGNTECEGDIGIVYDVSYTPGPVTKKPKEESVAELFLPLIDPKLAYYFHVQVALPNGCNTTWRINAVSPVEDNEGFLAYKSFY